MNRPFYAFGVLALFLAVAVLAVSSSSRSTSVGPGGRGVVARLKQPQPARGSGNYLVVLPAPDFTEADDTQVAYEPSCFDPYCDVPSYAQGCGLDRSTGEVYGPDYAECLAYRRLKLLRAPASSGPVAARIKPASHDASLDGDSRDCWSHYDADYDAIVYGTVNQSAGSVLDSGSASGQAVIVRWTDLEWEQSLHLFESLAGTFRDPVNAQKLEPQLRNAQTLWLGTKNAAERVLIRWGWPQHSVEWNSTDAAIDWEDYAELIVQAKPIEADSFRAESLSAVQSGRWLLRFAASHLDSAGELLSTAAAELLRYADEDRIANQADSAQR